MWPQGGCLACCAAERVAAPPASRDVADGRRASEPARRGDHAAASRRARAGQGTLRDAAGALLGARQSRPLHRGGRRPTRSLERNAWSKHPNCASNKRRARTLGPSPGGPLSRAPAHEPPRRSQRLGVRVAQSQSTRASCERSEHVRSGFERSVLRRLGRTAEATARGSPVVRHRRSRRSARRESRARGASRS